MAFDVQAMNYTAIPRWGQAATVISDLLFISGGKTDPQHQFTYSSAPNTNDILSLDLSMSFPMSSPPWRYLIGSMVSSTSQGPSVAFHTLTPFTSSELLLFGGDAGFEKIETNADSAWLLNITDLLSPVWLSQSPGWASEPMRRIYHAAPSAFGAVYIIGGQKPDGSQIVFPDSYVFDAVGDNGSPVFIPLSESTTAPSGLFGHAAHVLPDGSLMVFGGFFSSNSSLNVPSPLDTIYFFNTTSKSPAWSVRNASGGAVPSPRRGFASALLDDGKILIHGGADATLQTVFSDGAILDTTQDPMSWSTVDALSDTLGSRVGHFAEPINGQVLFGFGWAGNAPADANLVLYDPTSTVFQPTFTPAPSTVSVTTLPVSPTAPGGTYPTSGSSVGTTGVGQPGQSVQPPSPTSTSGTNRHSGPSSKTTGIVVGSVLGALGFAALAGATMYYAARRNGRRVWYNPHNKYTGGRWKLMPKTDPWDDALQDSPTHPIPTVRLVGTGWETRTHRSRGFLGLGALIGIYGATQTAQERRDMLADEDAYLDYDEEDFGIHREGYSVRPRSRREGTGGSSFSFASLQGVRSPWNSFLNASLTSLRNIGLTLGVTASGSDVAKSNDVRNVGPSKWWEKDELSLGSYTGEPEEVSGGFTTTGKDRQYIDNSNVDPFADPTYEELNPRSGGLHDDSWILDDHDRDKGVAGRSVGGQNRSLPPIPGPASLSLVLTNNTTTSSEGQNGGASLDSHNAPSSHTLKTDGTSNDSLAVHTDTSSKKSSPISLLSSSILSTVDPPIRRSNSWWLRFGRTPFLDRLGSQETRQHHNNESGLLELDFRDPNPLPRLGRIEESTSSSAQAAQEGGSKGANGHFKRQRSDYAPSTKSSIKTERTVDSELIARLDGRMEVVQRDLSLNSQGRVSSTTTLERPSDDLYRKGESSSDERRSWSNSSTNEDFLVQSPVQEAIPDVPLGKPRPPHRSTTGVVAARVSAYERRISQDPTPHDGRRASRTDRNQARQSVVYGLVPKSSLYVANPDARTGST